MRINAYMNWVVIEEQHEKGSMMHAGGKAREDLNSILLSDGFKGLHIIAPRTDRSKKTLLIRLAYHFIFAQLWHKAIQVLGSEDVLILQLPILNDTLFLRNVLERAKKRKIKIYAYIHDLELLRSYNDENITAFSKWRIKREECKGLKAIDVIIVHNEKMRTFINENMGIPIDRMVALDIFDYLIPEKQAPRSEMESFRSCIVAGNLIRDKSGYIYNLPVKPDFELYGINFEGACGDNVHYQGAFLADDLPKHLKGGFGLVWDGDSTDTCRGVWGSYLKYNNPHKTSLYLASGIPVIIWEKAAMAKFIIANGLGITINSLDEINDKLMEMSNEEYMQYKKNAVAISKKLTAGYYSKRALRKAMNHTH